MSATMVPYPLRRTLPAGATVFREGEPGDYAYIVEEGRVELLAGGSAGPVRIAVRGAGEIIGEMALIDEEPRTATAAALTPVKLIVIRREQLLRRIERAPRITRLVLRVLLGRLRELQCAFLNRDSPLSSCRRESDPALSREELDAFRARLELEAALATALSARELDIALQPIVDLATEAVAGFEALVRWRHPRRGSVPAPLIVETAEQSGHLGALDRFLYDAAFSALARMSRASGPSLYVSVNISAHRFEEPDFVDDLLQSARRAGIPPSRILIEITESALVADPDRAAAILDGLRASGFRIGLDDFGTGYSSLSYLDRFPVDILKLDRSFVRRCETEARTRRIVTSLITMCHALGIGVIAEGLETRDDVQRLRELGCRHGQGYLFGRPTSPEAAIRLASTEAVPA